MCGGDASVSRYEVRRPLIGTVPIFIALLLQLPQPPQRASLAPVEAAQEGKTNPPSDWWLKLSTVVTSVATLAIAGLGFFQWRVMHKQRLAMEQQANYMRDGLALTRQAADAAKLSAESFLADQRAWLFVDVEGGPPESYHPDQLVGDGVSSDWEFRVLLTNHGKSMAEVISAESHIEVVRKGVELPSIPAYRTDDVSNLRPNGAFPAPPTAQRLLFVLTFPTDRLRPIYEQEEALYVIGIVHYLSFGKPRETAFCRKYRIRQYEPHIGHGFPTQDGPKAYNRFT